jgi:hypothetical protein
VIGLCRALAWIAGTLLLLALGAAGILAAVFCLQGGDATLSLPHLASLLGLDSLRDAIDGWLGEVEAGGPDALVAALCGIGAVLLGLALLAGALLPGRDRLLSVDSNDTGAITARRRAVSAALAALAERSADVRSAKVRVRPHRRRAGGRALITVAGTRARDESPRAERSRKDLARLEDELSLQTTTRHSRRRESRVR